MARAAGSGDSSPRASEPQNQGWISAAPLSARRRARDDVRMDGEVVADVGAAAVPGDVDAVEVTVRSDPGVGGGERPAERGEAVVVG
jgi:hypothetical protein